MARKFFAATVSLGVHAADGGFAGWHQMLTARLKNYPDRTQNVTVMKTQLPTIEFSNARAPEHCQGETNTDAVVNWESRRQPETSFRRGVRLRRRIENGKWSRQFAIALSARI